MRWVQLCSSLNILWHCLSSGLEWKLTFSSPAVTAEFSKFAGILSAALSSFRVWNSSTGIPSPPLALLIVILPKAHLTSHSRISGFRWVITSSWLSGSLSSFLYSSSVYSCYLFLITSASARSIPFLSFIVPFRVVSSAYLRLLVLLLGILTPACDSSSPAFHVMFSEYKLNF